MYFRRFVKVKEAKIFLLWLMLVPNVAFVWAQSGIVSSGYTSDNIGYAIGQPFYTTVVNDENSLSQGVIQGYEIMKLSTSLNNSRQDLNFTAKLYPNPTTDDLVLSVEEQGDYNVYLFDNSGKQINSFGLTDKKHRIPLRNYSAGVYYLSIFSKNNLINTFKIIKK